MEVKFFETPDKAYLRYKYFPTPDNKPIGDIVILPGRSLCIEHYAEMAEKFNSMNYGVWIIDTRGHGGSSSLILDKQKRKRMHIENFDQYVDDLELWMNKVVLPTKPKCLLLLGNSFGGYCAVLFALKTKIKIDAMILAVPLVKPITIWPMWVMRLYVNMTYLFPFLRYSYAPGYADLDPYSTEFLEGYGGLDPERFLHLQKVFVDLPNCRTGGVTIGWAKASLDSLDKFIANARTNRIDIPTLLIKADNDMVVDNQATDKYLVPILTNKKILILENSSHEIILEHEAVWQAMWKGIEEFSNNSFKAN